MMLFKHYIILTFGVFLGLFLKGQENKEILGLKTNEPLVIDGLLEESAWSKVSFQSDFIQHFPYDTSLAETQTRVKVLYDDKFIYIGAECLDPIEGDYIVQSLKRDFSFPRNDAFAVFFDTFEDKENGFSFSVSPYNVQREGMVQGGGTRGVTTAWDNGWYSEVKRYKDKWVVEIAIPKKSIRFKEGNKTWGINFARNDLKQNENSCWSFVPRNMNVATLGYCGILRFEEAPIKTGTNMVLIPYAISGVNANYESNPISRDLTYNAGGDAKVAVSSSLNLDITINPDFAQVEVDDQQTNLTRFSLFFPEKRQFFIENSDLFGSFGFRQIRPFFSRRIGLNSGQAIPIYAGARLSGKVNRKLRIGLMNMQTGAKESLDLDAMNYSVFAFQRRILANSNIAGIVVNRFNTDKSNDNNTVLGLDFNYASKNNLWRGKAFYHHSIGGTELNENYAHATWLMYNGVNWFGMWNHEFVGKGYNAEIGFVPRTTHYDAENDEIVRMSYWRWEPMLEYRFYPKGNKIILHGPKAYLSEYQDTSFKTTQRKAIAAYQFLFSNTSELELKAISEATKLFFDTDVSFSGSDRLEEGMYRYNSMELSYVSNQRKVFNGYLALGSGQYYTGSKSYVRGNIAYRYKYWVMFTMTYSYNYIELEHLQNPVYLNLFGPKIDLTLSNKLFITSYFQYNDQINNFNINGRLQWRFKPMSDLFIVYSDNYLATDLTKKNRALIVKFSYWFGL